MAENWYSGNRQTGSYQSDDELDPFTYDGQMGEESGQSSTNWMNQLPGAGRSWPVANNTLSGQSINQQVTGSFVDNGSSTNIQGHYDQGIASHQVYGDSGRGTHMGIGYDPLRPALASQVMPGSSTMPGPSMMSGPSRNSSAPAIFEAQNIPFGQDDEGDDENEDGEASLLPRPFLPHEKTLLRHFCSVKKPSATFPTEQEAEAWFLTLISPIQLEEFNQFVFANQTDEQAEERKQAIKEYQAKDREIRAEITARIGSAKRGSEYGVLGRKKGTKNRPKPEYSTPMKAASASKRAGPKKGSAKKGKLSEKRQDSGKRIFSTNLLFRN